ncbi:hypothetical protein [Mucilaginibacter psychrotolerans]|uniref:Lipoprotein n=1 Tax=Mucilaginibacter psychrotolerans TaxID=1524096 RepID=A0A4Y8S860_9SPHI|nr:hypothetical protein [Mucilaginibacter psychrotolerans]TFF34831.1 hypothetical protein E2R66_20835 [Mucilaginibacter psychrotolerans]
MIRRRLIFLSLLSSLLLNACGGTNALDIRFGKGVNKSDVKIKMEVLGDAEIPLTQIYTGEKEFKIPNGYGENEWYFTYKDSLKGYFRHFKTNANNTHTYRFSIRKANNHYYVDADIIGVNDLKKSVQLK